MHLMSMLKARTIYRCGFHFKATLGNVTHRWLQMAMSGNFEKKRLKRSTAGGKTSNHRKVHFSSGVIKHGSQRNNEKTITLLFAELKMPLIEWHSSVEQNKYKFHQGVMKACG